MVRTIAELSVEFGIPFISGKDSSSGTLESNGRRIDVPPTLVVSAFGRVPDAPKLVTKDFKRAGNRLVIVGKTDPAALGGSVYADSFGQRGDRLFDAYTGASIKALWDAMLRAHAQGVYGAASAIAEGGVMLRLFEASYGSGLGARIKLDALKPGRSDGWLFGEFIGSALLEVPPGCDLAGTFAGIPCCEIGEVTAGPRVELARGDETIWSAPISNLAEAWSATFKEVVK